MNAAELTKVKTNINGEGFFGAKFNEPRDEYRVFRKYGPLA